MISLLWGRAASRRWRFGALLVALLAVALQIARAGSLSSIAPAGVTPGQAVNITGTGFNATAANNLVTLTPPAGPSQTALGTAIATLDSTSGLRRLTITVPSGLPVGTVSVRVTNRVTGEVSDVRPLDILSLSLPEIATAPPGATNVFVRVTGSPNSQFVAGNTRATFGTGITVRSTTVDSPTSLRAAIDVASNATLGPRDVAVISTTQRAVLTAGFTVGAPPPTNQPPTVDAGPDLSITLPSSASLAGTASDDGLPAGGQLTTTWIRISGPGTVTFGDASSRATTASFSTDGVYVLRLSASDSALSASDDVTVTVHAANRPPTITSSAPASAAEGQAYSYQLAASDPDNDPLTFALTQAPQGMTISSTGLISWTPTDTEVGSQSATVQAADGHGGVATQAFSVNVAPVITAIDVTPALVRFSAIGSSRALTVSGIRANGSSIDLTGETDLSYGSSNPFVASVDSSGVVHAVGNGGATITVSRGSLTDTAAVSVEAGVTLDAIDLSPSAQTLRAIGSSFALVVNGHFSNGDTRDLTSNSGTLYESSNPQVASVDGGGRVTATGAGDATITARSDSLTASSTVHVVVSTGAGFITGAVFDDAKGLPLPGATVALVADGSGPLAQPVTATADDRGRYALEGQAGDAVVRISSGGYTSVERRGVIPADGSTRTLDARLTPIDAHANALASAFGGTARDVSGSTTLVIAAGVMSGGGDLRVTNVSPQGLQGRLPYGWSPVAAVDIGPSGITFSQPASLTLPNSAALAANTDVTIASYDISRHDWFVATSSRVGADGRSVAFPVSSTGQFVVVAPDDAPFTPPAPAIATALIGVAATDVPPDATGSGDVVPRAAAPAVDVRANGRILLQDAAPLPSGTVVRAQVSEHFDLTDQSQVVPPPFSEDIVLFARGRPAGDGILGATFPITPSRSYTIQELLRGVVSVDVSRLEEGASASVITTVGGTVTDSSGDTFQIAPGALTSDAAVAIQQVDADALPIPVPPGFDLLGAVGIDLVGTTLAQAGQLSIPAPTTFNGADQVLVATVFSDPTRALRLRIIAVAAAANGRLTTQTTLGALTFDGARVGGEYLFLRAQQPVGFLTGQVLGTDGLPHAGALVTSNTAPFADVTSAAARFVVAGVAGADVVVRASDPATHDAGTRSQHVTTRDEVVGADVTLAASVPTVTATTPAAAATNVALDSSIVIDFSDAIDPSTISTSSVVLQAGSSTVAGQRVLSSGQQRLTFRPDLSLDGKTTYTLTLNGLRSVVGRSIGAFALTFTTVDPSKPSTTGAGLITGELPDEDGFVLITGGPGAAEANAAVTATNLRTQESATVLAADDGSFRVRVSAALGDDLTVALRDASGRDTTISLTQLQSSDGSTALGGHGGSFVGAHSRTGSVLPRALTQPGLFRLDDAATGGATVPVLPDGFTYADQFHLSIQAAQFNTLSSFTLSESQSRFPPQTTTTAPFSTAADLTVPGDFLVNGSLKFTATAVDGSGIQRTSAASTLVVAASPDGTFVETSQTADFPTVFLSAPKQSAANQVAHVTAVAPAARVDLEIPAPAGLDPNATLLLVRSTSTNGEPKLVVVDTLATVTADNGTVLRTNGRVLPGLSSTGDLAIVASRDPLTFVTGRLTGPTAVASVDGLPFVFQTDGPNGSFALPVRSGQPYTIRYTDAASGLTLGSSTGQAPATGNVDVGQPLAPAGTTLTVAVDPDPQAIVDINAQVTFRFSEPVDGRTLGSGIIVTDSAGARAFGTVTLASDGVTATFKPTRRWRFATTYRWGVAASVVAVSGARQAQPAGGVFTTFAPSIVSTTAIGTTHDVAVSGSTAVAATDAGLVTLDISSPLAPAVQAQVPFAGGAHGVALLPSPTFTDRTGQSHTGTFAAVANGDTTGTGRLDIVDVTNPAAATSIGSTQVSANGGLPNAVALTTDQRAIVAVQNAGAASVGIGDSVPADPANPSRAVGARYPAGTTENVNQTALLGDRIVTVGAAGLTVLDAAALTRRGGASTTGNARSVAVLPAFSMDVNGDGTIAAGTETFDLAVVANGSDGTLQFFRVPATDDPAGADPMLLSVIHFTGETTSVALDANERLAYVGLGARGVALVDLDGPASVQPIDADRNGTDDRILGIVDTPGSAERTVLALDRGLAFAADGAAGVTTLQLLPSRTSFSTLLRDPVTVLSGEEQDITNTSVAYTTDDAVRVTVTAVVPPATTIVLAIEDAGPEGDEPPVSFTGGHLATNLASGTNVVSININHQVVLTTRTIRLVARTQAGQVIASQRLALVAPDTTGTTLVRLAIGPPTPTLSDSEPTVKLGVAGFYADGRVLNVTDGTSGTAYEIARPVVATVDSSGLVTSAAGGATDLFAHNGTISADTILQVNRAAALETLGLTTDHLTFRAIGGALAYPVFGQFSDGRVETDVSRIPALTFSVADPAVATIDATGSIHAAGAGTTSVSAVSGSLQTTVSVVVDPRTPTEIMAISIVPPSSVLSLDHRPILARAFVTGTGALDGLSVTVTVTAGTSTSTTTLATALDGSVEFGLDDSGTAGTISASVTVVDPKTAAVRTDSRDFLLTAATGDHEPNDTDASASTLGPGFAAHGSLDATDTIDTYQVQSDSAGTLQLNLQTDGSIADGIVVIIRDAAGEEISRETVTQQSTALSVAIPSGTFYVTLQSLSGSVVSYTLTTQLAHADVTVDVISPMAGPPGTLVTISGSGFSPRAASNQVFFSDIAAEIVSATDTQLEVRVPANAVDGSIEVVSGDRHAVVAGFSTGAAVPRPFAYGLPSDPSSLRQDPTNGELFDVSRLNVLAKPGVSTSDMDRLAQSLGGVVVAYVPVTNRYFIQFAGVQSIDALNAARIGTAAQPEIVSASFVYTPRFTSTQPIDMLSAGGPSIRRQAFDLIGLPTAIDHIRSTGRLSSRTGFRDVRVGIIDTGFDPAVASEFPGNVEFYQSHGLAGLQLTTQYRDVDPAHVHGHGTSVASVIGAVNNGSSTSGILNSVLNPGETPFPMTVYGWVNPLDNFYIFGALDQIKTRGDIDVVNMSLIFLPDISAEVHALAARTLIVASAGNDGVRATERPARDIAAEENGMAVGAVAVANRDMTGEHADERAVFAFSPRGPGIKCNSADQFGGSNCGPEITIAAPGEDLYAVVKNGTGTYDWFGGTSGASPVVAGVAALLQAIRPSPTRLTPNELKTLLIHTATDISDKWPGPMGRVDALRAVDELLGAGRQTTVFITDEGAPGDDAHPGAIVAIKVDPLSGTVSAGSDAQRVVTFGPALQTLQVRHPRSIVVSPSTNNAFVYTDLNDSRYGEGLLTVSTTDFVATDFAPLSGAGFPAVAGQSVEQPPFHSSQVRPPLAISKDGRLIYVGIGSSIRIVKPAGGVDGSGIVSSFWDLPSPYAALADQFAGQLETRMTDLQNLIRSRAGPAGVISALTVSPDGKTLYVVVQSGVGTGAQPGFVIPVNIDLYTDENPGGDLDSRLTDYFKFDTPLSAAAGANPPDDEPADAAISVDGKRLYLVNGGVERFGPPDLSDTAGYGSLVVRDELGIPIIDAQVALINSVIKLLTDGETVAVAPGIIDTFDLTQFPRFAAPRVGSNVNFSWLPSVDSGGPVLSPSSGFGSVLALRPFSMAIKPDGARALVAYYQTGNFGVLDLAAQKKFPNANTAATSFTGIVGVTPAIPLDANLWPVAKPDERRLFPTRITYSQAGTFAAAVHTGVKPTDTEGGAVSFILDGSVGADLSVRAGTTVTSNGSDRPYYAKFPIDPAAVTTIFNYTTASGTKSFIRPRDVQIVPDLQIQAPRFGDRISDHGDIEVAWTVPATFLSYTLSDAGSPLTPSSSPGLVATGPIPIHSTDRDVIKSLFSLANGTRLIPDHLYRIAFTLTGSTGLIVKTSIDVVLKD